LSYNLTMCVCFS